MLGNEIGADHVALSECGWEMANRSNVKHTVIDTKERAKIS